MSRGDRQPGYAVLLMLVVLLSGSIALTAPLLPLHRGKRTAESVPGSRALQSARQSLLVYTTLYPYLYGPRGAGPGHLPCPDIDGSESPDPPCGNASPATGQLPRHVSLPGHRYAFVTDVSSTYRYIAASDLINNPVNRRVNDETLKGLGRTSPYLAWVESEAGAAPLARVPLSANAMIPGLGKLVAAWLLTRIHREYGKSCVKSMSASGRLQTGEQSWLVLIVDEVGDASDASDASDAPPGCAEQADTEFFLSSHQIEGVPALSHWFVRNRWHERIRLSNLELPLSADDVIFR